LIAPQPDHENIEREQNEGGHRAALQNEEVSQDCEEHRRAEPRGAERRKAWNEQGHRSGNFNQTRDDAEPLTHADLVEDLHHHRHAG